MINFWIRKRKYTNLGIFPETSEFESIMGLNVSLKGKCSMTNKNVSLVLAKSLCKSTSNFPVITCQGYLKNSI